MGKSVAAKPLPALDIPARPRIIAKMIRAFALALLCFGSFAAVYSALAPDDREVVAPETVGSISPAAHADSATPAEVLSPSDDVAFALRTNTEPRVAAADQVPAAQPVRNVTPDDMTAPPPVTAPLTRVDPPPGESPAPPEKARTARLFNPVIVSAGTIKANDKTIRIAGVALTEIDATCGDGASAWPCGRVARAALRRFVRGRAIECRIPEGADAIPDPATCLVAGDDIAEWLVAQGWAKRNGDTYAKAAKAAEDDGRGLYSPTRPDVQVEEVAERR